MDPGCSVGPGQSGPHSFGLVGPEGNFGAVSGSDLVHEAGEVKLDGAEADVEFVGDLGVVRPWATVTRTSSSRSVRGMNGWVEFAEFAVSAKRASRRVVTLGAMRALPSAAARMDEKVGPGVLEEEALGAGSEGAGAD